jgi:hypothetical protein
MGWGWIARGAVLVCVVVGSMQPAAFAQWDSQDNTAPVPLPPPLPRPTAPKGTPLYEPIVAELPDLPWGLEDEMLANLQSRATIYRRYSSRFTCDETARFADYDKSGSAKKERIKKYAYLIFQDEDRDRVREHRQEFAKNGSLKPAAVEDEERFPPAYAWVYLFSEFNAPYFSFRLLDTRFDGFDYVHVIQFRGASPFASGKDIRQWEGKILVDAFTFTPLEIVAEPTGQRDRLEAQYRIWNTSFSLIGFRTKPKPLGYKARIQFGLRRDELTFPTELRYDTKRAVSATQLIDVRASTRTYEKYLFTDVDDSQQLGDVREE